MTYDEFFKIFTEKYGNLDSNNLNAYINFILDNHNKFNEYKEAHHLLPRALFIEYEFNKDNIFNLSAGNHLEAHFLLYKLLPNDPAAVYSLNMMVNRGRMDPHFDMSSVERLLEKYKVEYEEYRLKVAKIISECNRGRKRSDEQKKHLSEVHKGKVTVKDNEGHKFRVAIDDPRLLSGELINARVGYKTSDGTKQKMREAREKYRNMKPYNNGKEVKFLEGPTEEFCHEGYLEKTKLKKIEHRKDKWINNGKEYTRIGVNDPIPEGWSIGRLKCGKFDGSAHINDRWFDLKTKEIINQDPGDPFRYKRYSKDFKEKEYPVFDGRLFTNVEDLIKYIREKINFNIPIVYNTVPILKGLCVGDLSLISEKLRDRAGNFLVTNNVKRLDEKLDIEFHTVYDVNFDNVKFYEFSTAKKGRFSK